MMEKSKDTQIYIFAHKPVPYGIYDNLFYTPVQVGFNDRFLDVCEWDEEDNLNDWNGVYAETSATYFVWKYQHPAKHKGQCQYRRRITFPEDTDFDDIFSKFDVIASVPVRCVSTVWQQYASCHSEKDMRVLEEVVKSLYPDYAESFDSYIKNGNVLFYSNSFIMHSEDYDRYAEWLFNILGEFLHRQNLDTPDKVRKQIKYEMKNKSRKSDRGINYQQQICGFLSERLWTLFLRHNFKGDRILCMKYEKFEGIEI